MIKKRKRIVMDATAELIRSLKAEQKRMLIHDGLEISLSRLSAMLIRKGLADRQTSASKH